MVMLLSVDRDGLWREPPRYVPALRARLLFGRNESFVRGPLFQSLPGFLEPIAGHLGLEDVDTLGEAVEEGARDLRVAPALEQNGNSMPLIRW